MEKTSIICPNCDHEFNVEEVLAKEVAQKLNAEFAEKQKTFEAEKLAFENKQKEARKAYKEKLEADRKLIEEEEQQKAIEKAERNVAIKLEQLEKQAEEKELLNRKLQQAELDLKERENQIKTAKENALLEAKKELLEKQEEIEKQAIAKTNAENELKAKEYQIQLEKQKELIEELKRKSEQGSMQLQGEAQEIAIEDYLKSKFPYDDVIEIKKGARGGDCIQIVNDAFQKECGKIYYESKRTQNFGGDWIEKFKADMRTKGIELGVIVTQTMPKDLPTMGLKDGVWICSFQEFKGLSIALREACIKIDRATQSQENKGEKMEMLYTFLTGAEFRMQMEAIVEGFTQMKMDIVKEQNAMKKIWKQREKQLEKVLTNTIDFYGSVKGIAGNAVPKIEQLELPGYDEDDENKEGKLF